MLSALEQGGQVRRGYFVERLGGSQFALPGAVDRLRVDAQVVERSADEDGHPEPLVVVLAATDPANPYGASLPWPVAGPDPTEPADAPARSQGRRARRARRRRARALPGARRPHGPLVLADDAVLLAAADGLAITARTRHAGRLTIARVDGVDVLGAVPCTGRSGRRSWRPGSRATPRGLRLRGQS